MLKADETMSESKTNFRLKIFIQGFSIRLIYGLAGVGVLALIRPNKFATDFRVFNLSVLIYLIVCIAGGIYDVSKGQPVQDPGLQKLRVIDIAILIFLILLFLLGN